MWRGGKLLIVVAHPDDETLGAGGEMEHWPDCVVAHTTDGSPDDLAYAQGAGFRTREDYSACRFRELACALKEVGGRETRALGFTDQRSWMDLVVLTDAVRQSIEEIQPEAVLTHPFEGGHPDHDGAAFAVQSACRSFGEHAPQRIEAAFYHLAGGAFHTNEFIGDGGPETEVMLSPAAHGRKERMFACFGSQTRVLRLFQTTVERFRNAPDYDFTRRPHEGPLHYETLDWNITFGAWTEAVKRTLPG